MRYANLFSLLVWVVEALSAAPFEFSARRRESAPSLPEPVVRESRVVWEPRQTAIIICDMWDRHWCAGATRRGAEMAPRMNAVVKAARDAGALVIHAPSECMEFYRDTPQRRAAQTAPQAANLPAEMSEGCGRLPDEPPLPIDDGDGGCDCQPPCEQDRAWRRQTPSLEIAEGDAISDSGAEIWNLLEARGIRHVVVMGVHTNMCVVGRSFGLRNLARAGRDVVLARDLTDSMYNPRRAPQVAHRRGTELVVAHIEQHVCPTVDSHDLIGEARRPRVVILIGEDEYDTARTLPAFAARELAPRGFDVQVLQADSEDKNHWESAPAALANADLLLLSVRRRTPERETLQAVRDYLDAGRPLVGIRTASHAFEPRAEQPVPPGHDRWDGFDVEVLGADYQGHYGHTRGDGEPETRVERVETAAHPVLAGFPTGAQDFPSWLYKNKDVSPSVRVLLQGEAIVSGECEPLAWTNTYRGGRVFYTSLGIPAEFDRPEFRRLLVNGIEWALEREPTE